MEKRVHKVNLGDILIRPSLQIREQTSAALVKSYATMMKEGATFPPIMLGRHDGQLILLGGHHRFQAARQIDAKEIEAEVIESGSWAELLEAAIMDNRHGAKLSKADRINAYRLLAEQNPAISDREAARIIGCDHKTIGAIKKELEAAAEGDGNGAEDDQEQPLRVDTLADTDPIRKLAAAFLKAIRAGKELDAESANHDGLIRVSIGASDLLKSPSMAEAASDLFSRLQAEAGVEIESSSIRLTIDLKTAGREAPPALPKPETEVIDVEAAEAESTDDDLLDLGSFAQERWATLKPKAKAGAAWSSVASNFSKHIKDGKMTEAERETIRAAYSRIHSGAKN